jgi:Apea-like HEPN
MSELGPSPEGHDGNWYVLISGLPRPATALTLAPGVSLRPLEQPLSIFDLASAGAVGFRGWAVLEPVAPGCCSEIESAKDAAILPGYDALNRAWLASALLVLRGFTRHLCVACSSYSWNIVAGHQERTSNVFQQQLREEGPDAAIYKSKRDLPRFQGNLLDFHLTLLTNKDARTGEVSVEDATWIQEHFDVFNNLAAESQPFRFALEAAIDWRFAKDARSAVARLWSGIEAIFGITSELVYRISLLSACLLAERGDTRKSKFEEVKKLYGLRSKVVHGEQLADEKIASALNDSYHLLASLLLLAINRGHVLDQEDFDQAVFG